MAGVRKFGESSKTEVSDIFSIGSCAKSMTAVVAAALVEEGLISWDTKPLDVYPELTGEINADFQNITLKDLLSHQAGVEPFYDGGIFNLHSDYPFITGSPEEQRKIFAIWQFKRPPVNDPGTFVYSNGGYAVAAAMLEEVSGNSWEQLIMQRLFKPFTNHLVHPGSLLLVGCVEQLFESRLDPAISSDSQPPPSSSAG